jgi:predicted amidohydrolase
VNICEDIWYPTGPTTVQALAGAELVVTINSSPYHAGKGRDRERMVATRAADDVVALAYVNMVGGQDELVFDGGSVIVNERGECVARGRALCGVRQARARGRRRGAACRAEPGRAPRRLLRAGVAAREPDAQTARRAGDRAGGDDRPDGSAQSRSER